MNMKRWSMTALALGALLGTAASCHKKSAGSAPGAVEVPIGQAPTLGPASAPVTIVEFSDFQ